MRNFFTIAVSSLFLVLVWVSMVMETKSAQDFLFGIIVALIWSLAVIKMAMVTWDKA